ncbi:MAG: YmaF family protein [Bacillota bacterium]
MPFHVHDYSGVTSYDEGHVHGYSGTTTINIGIGLYHVHLMKGVTAFDEGHDHLYFFFTGPGIPLGPGRHIHGYDGKTTKAGRPPHTHRERGETGPNY